jgi:hypothetical protein
MPDSLLAPTFLFRFSVPCHRADPLWGPRGAALGDAHHLPSFGELEQRPVFADVFAGWNESGLAFVVRVVGKQQHVWCRESRAEDSDGLHVWIDTRDTHTVHRASRFCHRFALLPAGGGPDGSQPVAKLLSINRAREAPKPIDQRLLQVHAEHRQDGYRLHACLPAQVLTGFDPREHDRLGFTYAVTDRELGCQTFTVGREFPFDEDPSLWGTLELVSP